MIDKIIQILSEEDLTWFTRLLKWKKVHRYVVAFTNNINVSFEELDQQYQKFSKRKNITIWGRKNQNNDVMIDIGTSTNSLKLALKIGSKYKQFAIRDQVEKEEIIL